MGQQTTYRYTAKSKFSTASEGGFASEHAAAKAARNDHPDRYIKLYRETPFEPDVFISELRPRGGAA